MSYASMSRWVTLFLLTGLIGCHDARMPTDPLSHAPTGKTLGPIYSQTQSQEMVAWNGNVLDFYAEDGTPVRMVRDQEDARTLWLYEDGVLMAILDLEWQGTEVERIRWAEAASSEWMRTTAEEDPVLLEMSYGGGGCHGEGCIYPEFAPSERCGEGSDYAVTADCSTFMYSAIGAAGAAVSFGILTVATAKTPISLWAARATLGASVAAVGSVGAYVACMAM